MDLDALKGKTLDDATHAALAAHVATLTEQRDAARQESIAGRKGKDAKLKELSDLNTKLMEKLGIDAPDEIDNLPDAKGQAEAVKQFEAKLTRAQRELAEKAKALDELSGRYSTERRERAIAEAVGKHPFIDAEDARALIFGRVKQEGDDLLFTTPEGKLVPLADGVAWMAKTKLHLVRAAGDGSHGSGFKGAKPGETGGKTMTRSAFDALPQIDRKTFATSGGQVVDD